MVKVEKLPRTEAWNKSAGWNCYLVKRDEHVIGLLSHHRDGPWLVDAGYGFEARFIGTAPDKKAAVKKLLSEVPV